MRKVFGIRIPIFFGGGEFLFSKSFLLLLLIAVFIYSGALFEFGYCVLKVLKMFV